MPRGPYKQRPLNPQELAFVAAFLANGGNADGAARAAGYAMKHSNVGFNLAKRPKIKAEIERRREELLQITIASPERVLRSYEAQAFINPKKLYDENNRIKPLSELDNETAFAVSKLKFKTGDEGSVTEIEIDRNAALNGICSMLGFKRPAQVDVQVSGTVSIEAVREVLERAFAPIRDVPAPDVIPIGSM